MTPEVNESQRKVAAEQQALEVNKFLKKEKNSTLYMQTPLNFGLYSNEQTAIFDEE